MADRASSLIIFLSGITLLLVSSATAAPKGPPKITTILNEFKEFSVINDLFTKYGLAEQMNDWGTLTVFVVDNAAMGPINALPPNKAKEVLMLHAILEFYAPEKFSVKGAGKDIMMLTTLLMTTGEAHGQRGFVIANNKTPGGATFGSAITGAQFKAKFVKGVKVEPPAISVIQISEPIIPPGV